jgi:hypothetical protein
VALLLLLIKMNICCGNYSQSEGKILKEALKHGFPISNMKKS